MYTNLGKVIHQQLLTKKEHFTIEFDYKKLIDKNTKDIQRLLKEKEEYLKRFSDEILESATNMATAYNEVGILYAENYYYPIAIQYFISSLKTKKDWNVFNNIANVYYIVGQDDLAIKYYKMALGARKDNPLILLNLSFIYYEKGKFKQAKKFYLKAVTIDPTMDQPEYKVLAGEHIENESKASNKGVERINLKWIK